MGFHHLLLSILHHFPSLQTKIEAKIHNFLAYEEKRTKKGTPNMGEFLCLLAVSKKYSWDDVSKEVLKETLDRNSSWIVDKYPRLGRPNCPVKYRLENSFKGSIVSIRLLYFNVWFLRNIVFKKYGKESSVEDIIRKLKACRKEKGVIPGNTESNGVSSSATSASLVSYADLKLAEYNINKGIPAPHEIEALQTQIKGILHGNGLNSWADYFISLNLKPIENPEDLASLLFQCLLDAVRKGYIPLFKMRQIQQGLGEFAPKKKPKKEEDDHLGADVDKYDDMATKKTNNKW